MSEPKAWTTAPWFVVVPNDGGDLPNISELRRVGWEFRVRSVHTALDWKLQYVWGAQGCYLFTLYCVLLISKGPYFMTGW